LASSPQSAGPLLLRVGHNYEHRIMIGAEGGKFKDQDSLINCSG